LALVLQMAPPALDSGLSLVRDSPAVQRAAMYFVPAELAATGALKVVGKIAAPAAVPSHYLQ